MKRKQSKLYAIICSAQRFAVKNSGMSCMASIFDLSNAKTKFMPVKS